MTVKKKKKRHGAGGGTWNHRVVKRTYRHKVGDTERVEVVADPIDVVGDNITGLRWTLRAMLRALNTPVLDYDTRREIREATPVKAKR